MDQIKNKEAFSDLLLYQQHEGEPEEPAGEVAIQGFERKGLPCAPVKERDERIGLNIWVLWPTVKLYYKAVLVTIQHPKLNKSRILYRCEK